MSVQVHDTKREIRKYIGVFGALLVLTVITVAASNLKVGLTAGIILALIIASTKGYLVAANFMHLSSEKKVIYFVLLLTVVFFIAMMVLIYVGYLSLPEGAHHVS